MREQYGSSYDNWTLTPDQWSKFMLGADMDDSSHKTMKVVWKVPYEWQGKGYTAACQRGMDETTGKGPAMDINMGSFTTSAPPLWQ